MRPPVILESTTTFSSSSDRRLNTIAKHFLDVNDQNQMASQNITPSPTASSDSVFAHLVRAPEDPILGVCFLLFLFDHQITVYSS